MLHRFHHRWKIVLVTFPRHFFVWNLYHKLVRTHSHKEVCLFGAVKKTKKNMEFTTAYSFRHLRILNTIYVHLSLSCDISRYRFIHLAPILRLLRHMLPCLIILHYRFVWPTHTAFCEGSFYHFPENREHIEARYLLYVLLLLSQPLIIKICA